MRLSEKQFAAMTGQAQPNSKQTFAGDIYVSNVRGWRVIGGKRYFFKSLWEINYANFLEYEKQAGQIKDWFYEPQTFEFPHDYKTGPYSYKPDFKVIRLDDTHRWHEVKGRMTATSRKKIKRFHKYFKSEQGVVLIDGTWFQKANKMCRGIIPGWESLPQR